VAVAHGLERAFRLLARNAATVAVGDELAAKYKVQEFPTVVVLSPDGREIGRLGYIPGGVKAFAAAVNAIVAKSRQQEQH